MSPSWRDRFEISLCHDEVAVRRMSAGLRPREDIVSERVPKEALIDSLGNILDRLASNRGTRLPASAEILLSESFVRHVLLPWSPLVYGKSERAALLQACFADAYGDSSLDWLLVADRGEYEAAAPASGVERSLLNRIAAILASRRIRLRSVTPFFSAVFNRYSPGSAPRPTVLAAGDSEWTTLATFVDGRWNSLRSIRLTGEPEELRAALTREALLQGLPKDARKLLCVPIDVPKREVDGSIELLQPWGTLAKPLKATAMLKGCWSR